MEKETYWSILLAEKAEDTEEKKKDNTGDNDDPKPRDPPPLRPA